MAELAALADGTLPADRRAAVEARVAASPDLQKLVEQQRLALRATGALAGEEVPESLRAAVEARSRALGARRERSRRLAPRLALAAVVAAAAVIAGVVLSGGPGAPTVADAARLATQPSTAPPPAASSETRLALGVEGVAFPDFARTYGWRALGVRHARIDGREATVVFYGKNGRRLGYVIVAGSGLARPSGAPAAFVRRTEYQTLRLDGRLVVTWRRGGHTCVLSGPATRAELLKLASWPLTLPR
jgi:anti-sigma factor RsiW